MDAKCDLTHCSVTTAVNEHDLKQVGKLLHGDEVCHVSADMLIAERLSKENALKQHSRKNKPAIRYEYMKASIRAKVVHPFWIVKCQFGFVKTRYKGLAKNDSQLAMLFTPVNRFRVDQLIPA